MKLQTYLIKLCLADQGVLKVDRNIQKLKMSINISFSILMVKERHLTELSPHCSTGRTYDKVIC